MASTIKGVDKSVIGKLDGSGLRVAIVHARWNKSVIEALVGGAVAKLKEAGVKDNNIVIESVPGSFEIPYAVQRYAISQRLHVRSVQDANGVHSAST